MTKKHYVVLGGGIAALAAAFEMTQPDNWQDNYDITIYSLGWRLGGKGATGRDHSMDSSRVFEHGLHIWFGCYTNAFRLMWDCFEALDRPPDAPLATIQQAFDPQNFAVYTEYINGVWLPWYFDFPTNKYFPGDPTNPSGTLPIWVYFQMGIQWLVHHFRKNEDTLKQFDTQQVDKPRWWESLAERIEHPVESLAKDGVFALIDALEKLVGSLESKPEQHTAHDHNLLQWLLSEIKSWLEEVLGHFLDNHTDIRRLFILADLGLTTAIGFLKDGVLIHGFNPLDQYDLREWYKRHHASPFTYNSAIINAMYDSFFAYDQGDRNKPDFAAGSALASTIQLMFTYKGSVMWKMRAGTGDTVVAPLYQVLKKRGVKFKFFHRVTKLEVDGNQISKIHLSRQVDVKDDKEYEPLVDLDGLPTWTLEPDYNQLVQGEALKASGANLESRWAKWEDVGTDMLVVGDDFDEVILGISYGALPALCQDLINSSDEWKAAMKSLSTVQTQAAQLWFEPDLKGLGWDEDPPMLSGYAKNFSSWADFSQIIEWEHWNGSIKPQTAFYSSDVLLDDHDHYPPPDDYEFPAEQKGRVEEQALQWLRSQPELIWPKATQDDGQLDWSTLAAPDDVRDIQRFQLQYWRANIDPSERYVLSPAGTNNIRIRPTDTGFTNLYCVGTWTYNWWYNLSAMEIAVTSGMQVSRAICGIPKDIAGEQQKTI